MLKNNNFIQQYLLFNNYFNNVLTTFWALNMVVVLLSVHGQKALGFHQYLICVSDMNEGLMGLERHEDEC